MSICYTYDFAAVLIVELEINADFFAHQRKEDKLMRKPASQKDFKTAQQHYFQQYSKFRAGKYELLCHIKMFN